SLRPTDEVNPRRVDIREAIPIDVHADLDDPHELHEVDDRLQERVAKLNRPRALPCRARSFDLADAVVTVLIDTTAGVGKDQRCAVRLGDLEFREWPEALAYVIDTDGGDPVLRELGG